MRTAIDSSPAVLAPRSAREFAEIEAEIAVEKIPAVATLEECSSILKISRTAAWRMRQDGTFPVPEMEPRFPDNKPRFAGEDILAEIRRRARNGREPRRGRR